MEFDLSKIEPISKEPFEFGPIQTKWLEALESGNYKQTNGYLKNKHGYCCLGVLCEVMGLEIEEREGTPFFKSGDSASAAYVPTGAVEAAGLHNIAGELRQDVGGNTALTSLNDHVGWSFSQIAAYIRHDPHNVFERAA